MWYISLSCLIRIQLISIQREWNTEGEPGPNDRALITFQRGDILDLYMDTCICMAESLCCSFETITTLLMGYTPIQNKKFNLKKGGDI